MSMEEQMRLKMVTERSARRMAGPEAAKVLRLLLRQVRRIVAAYRNEGAAGLAHATRGRVSPRRILAVFGVHYWALGLYRFAGRAKLASAEA